MKKLSVLGLVALFALIIVVTFAGCNQNEPSKGNAKTHTQISYTTEVNSVSSSDVPYNGELTDSQIMSIYNMALSTYGDRGLYHYVTFSEAKTEKEIKEIALDFGKKADNMVRSQYKIPDDLWAGYTKVIFKVHYTFDGNIVTVATYDYLK